MNSRPRDVALAYLTSGVLHAAVVAVLFAATVSLTVRVQPASIDTSVAQAAPAADSDELIEPAIAAEPGETILGSELPPPPAGINVLAEADPADARLAAFARDKLRQARDSAAEKTLAEQLADLEALGRRLNRVSSQESVAAVAEAVAPWIGSGPRATEPTGDVDDAQPFDVQTGQIIEVHRHGEAGAFQYTAVMLDAAGRTREVPLDRTDGEELYDVFQLMKTFPLLETVYRNAALGLLDKLVAEEQAAAAPVPDVLDEDQQSRSDTGDQQQD